jgi:hypothetical protein
MKTLFPTRTARGALRTALTLALFAALMAPPLSAQATGDSFRPGAGAGAIVEGYNYDDPAAGGRESLLLVTAPFFLDATFARNFYFRLDGAYAWGQETLVNGDEIRLQGLTDTNMRLDYTFGQDAVIISALASLPTGNASLTAREAGLAGAIAADLLPFRISNWGAGGYFGAQVSAARQFGGLGTGLSVSYLAPGEFEPLEDNPVTYQPGQQLRVQLALDGQLGRNGQGSLLLGWQNNQDDVSEGTNLYQSGTRFDITGSYSFAAGYRSAGVAYGGWYHRDTGTYIDGIVPDIPAQDLILLGIAMRRPQGRGWMLPRADARIFRRADGTNQGWLVSLGTSVETATSGTIWVPTFSFRAGKLVVAENAESWIYGLELGISVGVGR